MACCTFDMLVDDILVLIFQALSPRTVLALRQTSWRFHALSRLRAVWHAQFCTHVLDRHLPVPGPSHPLPLLSAIELERRTLRALHLDRKWPRLSATTIASSRHTDGAEGRVDQVVFIPGGTELLTVRGDRVDHWLILGWPTGLTQGLRHVGEWTPIEGVPCRIVKDDDAPGIIAVGPRAPHRFHRFAKVVSTRLKAPFVMLCDYARVPGIMVGVWGQLLMLDTTTTREEGGLEVLDWHARTTGTALLPWLPDVFGGFLDFVVFSEHLLVVWEHCVSVFPMPRVPAEGQVLVEPKRVFMFHGAVSRPIAFTTCIARRVMPDDEVQLAMQTMSPTLTIAARSRRRPESVSMVMLVPLEYDEGRDRLSGDMHPFPYRLTYLPPHEPLWDGAGPCTTLSLGSSGRGVVVTDEALRLVSPGLLFIPPYEMQFGPVFETGKAVYAVRRQDEWTDASQDQVDFDEGMGRFVVANARGGFNVVQLD